MEKEWYLLRADKHQPDLGGETRWKIELQQNEPINFVETIEKEGTKDYVWAVQHNNIQFMRIGKFDFEILNQEKVEKQSELYERLLSCFPT